jgi:hypothetical protein
LLCGVEFEFFATLAAVRAAAELLLPELLLPQLLLTELSSLSSAIPHQRNFIIFDTHGA